MTSSFPTCWLWPVYPLPALRRGHGESVYYKTSTRALIDWWQVGRCAICGTDQENLKLDHDHNTGYIRGYLCHPCNIWEGKANDLVLRRYRQWHPATILQLPPERHVDPFTGVAAQPKNRDVDIWASSGSLGL